MLPPRLHELAKRTDGDILVRLLWDPLRDRVVVHYRDARTGEAFAADVPKERALDAFHHPNAYRPPTVAAFSAA